MNLNDEVIPDVLDIDVHPIVEKLDIINRKIVTNKAELQRPLDSVSLSEDELRAVSVEMFKKMELDGGIGLAANQIGIDERICVIKVKEPIFLVNPRVIETSDKMVMYYEGCLSFPSTIGKPKKTKRFQTITVVADNHNGKLFFGPDIYEYVDWGDRGLLECIAVQHELSHLEGRTIYDSLLVPPVSTGNKIGRNDKVMFINKETGKTLFIKYKKGLHLLKEGWEIA